MNYQNSDKFIEKERYDQRAKRHVSQLKTLATFGSSRISLVLRAPYLAYEAVINERISKDMSILELTAWDRITYVCAGSNWSEGLSN